jgi:hypothetical protein
MTIVTGKHKELLVELLIYYLNKGNVVGMVDKIVDDIKAQNKAGQWYVNYYLNDYGSVII